MPRIHITEISISEYEAEFIDVPDSRYEPEAVLRAKSELLAEFLGCTPDEAERVILNRVCDIGV